MPMALLSSSPFCKAFGLVCASLLFDPYGFFVYLNTSMDLFPFAYKNKLSD